MAIVSAAYSIARGSHPPTHIPRPRIRSEEERGEAMSDEPESLVLRLLQDMRRDMDTNFSRIEGKIDALDAKIGALSSKADRHDERLNTHSENFEDIGGWLREIRGLLKDYAIAQELRRTMKDLVKRVAALEGRRQ
jgi:hypothetical protein